MFTLAKSSAPSKQITKAILKATRTWLPQSSCNTATSCHRNNSISAITVIGHNEHQWSSDTTSSLFRNFASTSFHGRSMPTLAGPYSMFRSSAVIEQPSFLESIALRKNAPATQHDNRNNDRKEENEEERIKLSTLLGKEDGQRQKNQHSKHTKKLKLQIETDNFQSRFHDSLCRSYRYKVHAPNCSCFKVVKLRDRYRANYQSSGSGKWGGNDDDDNNNNNNNNNATNGATSRANGNFAAFSKAGGYAYTTDFSGGYYRKSPPPSCGDTASSHRNYRRCESQDSFFDDVLKSPRNDANTSSSSSAGDGNHASHAAPQQTQSQRPIHRTTHTKSKQKGIGFSLAPLGKHLSIHVPSRHEIVMAMSRGERLHNFGTRVTLTSMESKRIHRQDGGERGDGGDGGKNRQRDGSLSLFNCANGEEEVEQEMEPKEGNRVDEQVEDDGKENIRQSVREDYDDDGIRVTDASGNLYGKAKGGTIPTSDDRHGISEKQPSKRRPTRKIVSTTTRFANGTQRVVKRTAYLHSDGTREVVVEENGVERRRYLVDGLSAQESEGGKENNTPGRKGCDASSSPESGGTGESDGTNSGKGNGNNGRDRSWYLNIFETCFAPCGGPAMVT